MGDVIYTNPQKKHRLLRISGAILGVAALVIIMMVLAVLLMAWLQFDDLKAIQGKIDSLKPIFTSIRVSLLLNIVIFWNRFNIYLANKFNWDSAQLQRILEQRYKVIIALTFLELFINQRILDYWI